MESVTVKAVEPEVVKVYNPYVLHLLCVKMRYLFNVINRIYRRHEDNFTYLAELCVLKNHYADVLVQDLILLRNRMHDERFPVALAFCHFEVYLFRATQIFRTSIDTLDMMFTSGYYLCEAELKKTITRDTHTMGIQKLLRGYTEDYYLRHAKEKSLKRNILFFNMKTLLEKVVCREVANGVIDKENSLFYINYDTELISTLFYLYFISQLYCLNEMDSTKLNPSLLLDACVVNQRKLFSEAANTANNKTDFAVSEEISLIHTVLQRAFHTLCTLYQSLAMDRIVFYSKQSSLSKTTTTGSIDNNDGGGGFLGGFFSSSTTTTTTTTTTTPAEDSPTQEEIYVNYLKNMNQEYRLGKPFSGAMAPILRPCFEGRVTMIGRSAFYNAPVAHGNSTGTILVPVCYIPLEANAYLYTLCLYRIAFDVKLYEAHTICRATAITTVKKNIDCYLCAYSKRDKDNNLRIRDFITSCNSFDIENPSGSQSNQYARLCEELDKVHLYLMPTASLRNYKTLTTVCWLFEFIPLSFSKVSEKRTSHNLFRMIDPSSLLEDLTRNVTKTELNEAVWNLICISYKKLNIENELLDTLVEQDHELAKECEIVRLFSEAVNMQFNQIQCYERSLSTEITLDATHLCREVAAALKKIYMAHLKILLQVISERRDHVNFNI